SPWDEALWRRNGRTAPKRDSARSRERMQRQCDAAQGVVVAGAVVGVAVAGGGVAGVVVVAAGGPASGAGASLSGAAAAPPSAGAGGFGPTGGVGGVAPAGLGVSPVVVAGWVSPLLWKSSRSTVPASVFSSSLAISARRRWR